MQTKSQLARIAASIALAVILPIVLLVVVIRDGKKATAKAVSAQPLVAANTAGKVSPADSKKWVDALGKLPMRFEENRGQTAPEVRYVSRGAGYDLFLTGQEAVVSVRQSTNPKVNSLNRNEALRAQRMAPSSDKVSVIRMKIVGANSDAQLAGMDPLPGKVNYFIGNDPKKWHTDVPTYSQVKYSGVYPGIDLVYYGNQRQLEYDFVLAPGADPKAIAIHIDGAKNLRIDKRGNLVMAAAHGDVTLQKPFVYQEQAGERKQIAGNYEITRDRNVRFALGAYDRSEALTIDPAVLIYSTYLGGSGADFANGLTLDTLGDAWVVGSTSSTDFPVQSGYQTSVPAEIALGAGFVSEISPDGSQILYSSYLGGSGNTNVGDSAYGVAVDAGGTVFVSGVTSSTDFPVTPTTAVQPTAPESASNPNNFGSAFLTRLNPSLSGGAQLLYSTYLGGNGPLDGNGLVDQSFSVATDGSGKAFVAGVTQSSDFKLKNAIIATLNSPQGGGFLTEIDTTASSGTAALLFSTYLSGSGVGTGNFPYGDSASGVTLDANGNIYVAGTTSSTDYPHSLGTISPCGSGGNATAFVTKINTSHAPPLLFSACVGGSDGDTVAANSLALSPTDGNAVITGQTFASTFPTTANTIPVSGGVPNAGSSLVFVSKIDTTVGAALKYSTMFGGTNGDVGSGIGVDSTGNIYVGGETNSPDFAVTQGAFQEVKNNNDGVAFVSKVNPGSNGQADLVYSSYFGGSGNGNGPDGVFGLGVTSANAAVIAGQTTSPSTGANPFPVSATAAQQNLNGAVNAFVAELPLVATIAVAPTSLNFGTQLVGATTAPQFVTVTNNTTSSVNLTIPPTFAAPNGADFAYSASPTTPCGATLAGGASCQIGATFTPSINGAETSTMQIADSDDTANHPLTVALSGTGVTTGPIFGYSPTSLSFGGQLIGSSSAAQTVTVTNSGNADLIIGTIGSSSSIFTETDTCANQTIAAGSSCVINVTFAPDTNTTPGAVSGTITIADNANGNPHTIPVSGSAWDFSLTVPATSGVNHGNTATFPVTINGLGGFTGSVGVACSAGMNITSCTVNPSSGSAGATVTVSYTAASFVVGPQTVNLPPPASMRQIVSVALAMAFLFMIPMARRYRTRLGLVAAMLVFVVVAGCSGHTPTKTSTLTITGSSGTITKTYTTNVTIN